MRACWCGAPSRTRGRVVSFITVVGFRQRSHSRVRVPRDSGPYLSVSDSRLPPTWTARSPCLYSPGTGWPNYTPKHWVPFSSPRLAGLGWWYWNPCPRGGDSTELYSSLYSPGKDSKESVSSIIVFCRLFTQLFTWQWVYISVWNCATYERWSLGSPHRGSRWTHGTFVP
jgi:hypothetical protein